MPNSPARMPLKPPATTTARAREIVSSKGTLGIFNRRLTAPPPRDRPFVHILLRPEGGPRFPWSFLLFSRRRGTPGTIARKPAIDFQAEERARPKAHAAAGSCQEADIDHGMSVLDGKTPLPMLTLKHQLHPRRSLAPGRRSRCRGSATVQLTWPSEQPPLLGPGSPGSPLTAADRVIMLVRHSGLAAFGWEGKQNVSGALDATE